MAENLAFQRAMRQAGRQAGVISRAQALACGLSAKAIRCHLARGRWRRVFSQSMAGRRPGVYAVVNGPVGWEGRLWAAVLACGTGATLSHETAAILWGLLDRDTARYRPIHVTVPSERSVIPPPGVVVHYSGKLDDRRHPAVEPARVRLEETVVDLTQVAPSLDAASGLIADAVQRRLTTHDRVKAAIGRRRSVRWRRELLETCGDVAEGAQTLLEIRYVRQVERGHGLPAAVRQVRLKADGRTFVVDNRYPDFHTRVELDGQRGHTGDGVFRDMWRDNAAAIQSEWQLRFGWDDTGLRSCESAAVVAKVLTEMGYTGDLKPCGPNCRALETFHGLLNERAA